MYGWPVVEVGGSLCSATVVVHSHARGCSEPKARLRFTLVRRASCVLTLSVCPTVCLLRPCLAAVRTNFCCAIDATRAHQTAHRLDPKAKHAAAEVGLPPVLPRLLNTSAAKAHRALARAVAPSPSLLALVHRLGQAAKAAHTVSVDTLGLVLPRPALVAEGQRRTIRATAAFGRRETMAAVPRSRHPLPQAAPPVVLDRPRPRRRPQVWRPPPPPLLLAHRPLPPGMMPRDPRPRVRLGHRQSRLLLSAQAAPAPVEGAALAAAVVVAVVVAVAAAEAAAVRALRVQLQLL